ATFDSAMPNHFGSVARIPAQSAPLACVTSTMCMIPILAIELRGHCRGQRRRWTEKEMLSACRRRAYRTSCPRQAESHHRFVHEGAALAVLDLDDPQIGIELHLLVEIGARLLLVGPVAERTGPYEVALAAARLAQHQDMSVEAVELEEHRAGFLDALLGDEGLRAFDLGAADEGANENPGFEAWRHGASIEEYPGGPCLMDQAARNGMILASFTATRSPFSATAAKGSRMRTVVPSPSTDSSVASPPCRVLSALTSARPRPVPSLARTCSPSTCSKGLPSLSRSLAEMPTPESATEISMPRSSRTALRRTSPPRGVYLIALVSRLMSICFTARLSAKIVPLLVPIASRRATPARSACSLTKRNADSAVSARSNTSS